MTEQVRSNSMHTYGFPLELTEEILAENGFSADEEGFKTHMQAQKELARKNRKSNEDEGWDKNELELNVEKDNIYRL